MDNKYNFKKKVSDQRKGIPKKISSQYLKFIHKIFDTINLSLLILVFTLFFISLNSQRKWSNTYKYLSTTIEKNNTLIDYISKTEEFYISKLDSLNNFKKTSPKDLIYLDNSFLKKENFFYQKFKYVIKGFKNSRYQKGY